MGSRFSRVSAAVTADDINALQGHLAALTDAGIANEALMMEVQSVETQLQSLKMQIQLAAQAAELAQMAQALQASQAEVAFLLGIIQAAAMDEALAGAHQVADDVVDQLELLDAGLEAALEAIDLEVDVPDLEAEADLQALMADIDLEVNHAVQNHPGRSVVIRKMKAELQKFILDHP